MIGNDYKEVLEDGKLLLYVRNAIFQARVYIGDGKYIHRSLKTANKADARKAAVKLLNITEHKQEQGYPLKQLTFSQLINEYVAMRQKQYEQSLLSKQKNPSSNENTTKNMLRQINRVVKFWHEYCGNTALEKMDNAVLQGYVSWRKDYYHRMPVAKRPRNYKINPTDKTLQWEVTLGKSLVKYAMERGYRGNMPMPTYSFTGVKKIVRPAFTRSEFAKIVVAMRAWIKEADNEAYRYTRILLRDYVLILSDTGMRVGEANNLKWGDLTRITDQRNRPNYEIKVRGKTGARTVVGRTNVYDYFNRIAKRKPDRAPTDYIFTMRNGSQVITLIDQFQALLKRAGVVENTEGERFTLYSLRHFYAVRFLRKGKPIFDIARNMGTSVKIIMDYYGKQATPSELATSLGS